MEKVFAAMRNTHPHSISVASACQAVDKHERRHYVASRLDTVKLGKSRLALKVTCDSRLSAERVCFWG